MADNKKPLSGDESGLVAYWNFDQDPTEGIRDLGPYGIHLHGPPVVQSAGSNPTWVSSSLPDFTPDVGAAAVLFFDKRQYTSEGMIGAYLRDSGLHGLQVTNLVVESGSGDREFVTLQGSPPLSGQFSGSILLEVAEVSLGNDILEVRRRDILHASYLDLDDGSGTQRILTASAEVDFDPPPPSPTATVSQTPTLSPTCTQTVTPTVTQTHLPAPHTIYVAWDAEGASTGDSWQDAFQSVSQALAYAGSGDWIWVKQGHYVESIHLKEGVEVFGGFSGSESETDFTSRNWIENETILDAGSNSHSTVTGADGALLDGFTITGAFGYNSSGVFCVDSSPNIRNCTITGNESRWIFSEFCFWDFNYYEGVFLNCYCREGFGGSGGGVLLSNSFSLFENCTITGNRASSGGGGVYIGPVDIAPTTNCWETRRVTETRNFNSETSTIESSQDNTYPTFVNCVISANQSGRGALCVQESSARFVGCQITSNFGTSPAACYTEGAQLSFENCLYLHNHSPDKDIGTGQAKWTWGSFAWPPPDGEIYHAESSVDYINCTFYDNNPGGIRYEKSSVMVTNCIAFDTPHQDLFRPRFSINLGGNTRDGNIVGDPLFVDPEAGNFRLRPFSPCIDTGIGVGIAEDIDGNSRPVDIPGLGFDGPGVGFDMGAYEFQLPFSLTNTPTASPTRSVTATSSTTFSLTDTPTPTPTLTFTLTSSPT